MDAIIFDFDGLILDTEWPAFVSVAEAFSAHGSEMTLERWQSRVGRGDNAPWTELLEADVGPIDAGAVVERRQRRNLDLIARNEVMPGVIPTLDTAHALGLATAVASSSPRGWVAGHLTRLGLRDRFVALRTRDDVARAKPWPDVFLAASAALGVVPERCLVFEDSSNGVVAAKEAGMTCVAVPNRVTTVGDFGAADLVVKSLADVDLVSLLHR